ncbi:MAG: tetratricopeptide repeat protein [Candidatus Omnitrophota bacterium]
MSQFAGRFFLAKIKIMYYPYFNKFRNKTFHGALSFLFFIVFLNTLSGLAFAEVEFSGTSKEYATIGYQAQQEGDFNRALVFYSKALTISKEDAWIYNNVGVIYEQMGLVDQAESNYLNALEVDPEFLPPYTNLAFLYKGRGDVPGAVRYFKERINRAKDNDQWVPLLTQELSVMDPAYRADIVSNQLEEMGQRLYEMAQEELSLSLTRSEGHLRRGKELLQENSFDEAEKEINKALALTPKNPKLIEMKQKIGKEKTVFEIKAVVQRALEFLDAGDMESSRKEFQKTLTIFPGGSVQE